jgi:hypothetical protein
LVQRFGIGTKRETVGSASLQLWQEQQFLTE